MANVFLSIAQYKQLPESEINKLKKELEMDWWEPFLRPGFHPMFDQSINDMVRQSKHKFKICTISGDGNLPRVRSINAAVWRRDYDIPEQKCDYLMMLDDDLSWPANSIDILIDDDKPIVGGIYTFKTDNPNYMGKICTQLTDKELPTIDRPFEVRWLNGGFILARADAMLKMIEAYPGLRINVGYSCQANVDIAWALWMPMIYELNGYRFFLGEDWAFCQRASDIGINLWGDMRPKLIHWNGENGYAIHL